RGGVAAGHRRGRRGGCARRGCVGQGAHGLHGAALVRLAGYRVARDAGIPERRDPLSARVWPELCASGAGRSLERESGPFWAASSRGTLILYGPRSIAQCEAGLASVVPSVPPPVSPCWSLA